MRSVKQVGAQIHVFQSIELKLLVYTPEVQNCLWFSSWKELCTDFLDTGKLSNVSKYKADIPKENTVPAVDITVGGPEVSM